VLMPRCFSRQNLRFGALRALLLLAVVGLARPAHSGPPGRTSGEALTSQVERLAARGVEYYQKKDYRAAIKFFLEAYRVEPVTDLLYNLARCYEALGEQKLAMEYYQQYSQAADAEQRLKTKALVKVQELQEAIAARAEAEEGAEEDEGEGEEGEEEQEGQEKEEGASSAGPGMGGKRPKSGAAPPVGPPPAPARGSGLRLAGFVALGAAAALAATGGVLGYTALQRQDTFHQAAYLGDKQKLRQQAESYALLADLGFGAAIACGLTGGLLLLLAPGSGSAQAAAADDPAVSSAALPPPFPLPASLPGGGLSLTWGGGF